MRSTFSYIQSLEVTRKLLHYIHTYVLEQLLFAAPREWIHLPLAHGIDWPSFPHGRAILPPPTAWLALVSVINNLSVPAVP
jgi:hypothetical protein